MDQAQPIGPAVTKIFTQISLAIFLAALLAPCGIVPRHQMPATASAAGMMCAGHESGASQRDSAPGVAEHGIVCGVDMAAPRMDADPALLVRHAASPAFDVIAARQAVALAPRAHALSRAGPPSVPARIHFPAQRLLL